MNITKQIMAWADRVLPNNYLILILLAILMIGLPVFPRAYLLGKYAALLNLSALFAILFIWTLVREYRNDLTHIIDGRRLGLDRADFDVDESLFSRPFYFLTSTVGLFLGLWAVITGSVAAVFYNLCVASELYCPFDQELTRLGVALFFADQASKGMFFDAMEVFNVDLESGLTTNTSRYPLFGGALVVFRLFVAFSVIQLFLLYLSVYGKGKDERLVVLAKKLTARS